MEEIMLKIDNVSKTYKLGQIGGTTLYSELQRLNAKLHHKEDPTKRIGAKDYNKGETFMALDGVSFEVKKGERVGIIGHNGAGKSTLLKLVSRVTAPTGGTISMNGRVASMLEVGTGFHQELTGRENIYMNGAILGMTKKEIDAKIEDIIEFSECRQFIDTPVKRYSSGMYVKLAFSVAAHLDSEIMIMDEVLAVGDMAFQKKCLDKMSDVSKAQGRTIFYVSHNMNTIRELCDRVIVLNHGKIAFDGGVDEGIATYMNESKDIRTAFLFDNEIHQFNGLNLAQMVRLDIQKQNTNTFVRGDNIYFSIVINGGKKDITVKMRFEIKYVDGSIVGTMFSDNTIFIEKDKTLTVFGSIDTQNISPGFYSCVALLFQDDKYGNQILVDRVDNALAFEILPKDGDVNWLHKWWGHTYFDDIKIDLCGE